MILEISSKLLLDVEGMGKKFLDYIIELNIVEVDKKLKYNS